MLRINTLLSAYVTQTPPSKTLAEAQCRYPLLRLAFERIAEEVEHRSGCYLRRLDSIHASGSRTHQQTWDALTSVLMGMFFVSACWLRAFLHEDCGKPLCEA